MAPAGSDEIDGISKGSEVSCMVTAAELHSIAAFVDGLHAQGVPSLGSERMGAPVVAYGRIDDGPIRGHDPVVEADAVVVQDPTLLQEIDVFAELRADGYALINTGRSPDELGLADPAGRLQPGRLVTVPPQSWPSGSSADPCPTPSSWVP